MTAPTTMRYSEFLLELEVLGSPGTYMRPCGMTSRSFDRTFATVDSEVPGDCDNEDVPMVIERGVKSSDWSVDCSLTIDVDDQPDWEARLGTETNVRISRLKASSEIGGGGGTTRMGFTGSAIITKFTITGEFGSKAVTASATITGAGKLTAALYAASP